MIYLLRASHANEFELQNYAPIAQKLRIQVITSQHPLTQISLPTTQLWSPTDLPDLLLRRQLLNRLIGGEQWLYGLQQLISSNAKRYNDLNHDIIHTAETYTPYTHQAVELRKRGEIAKLVCTCWETIPHNNEKFARLRKWKEEAYQYVDIFHTPTERAKDALVTEGVDQRKIMVIPYGVDLTRFCPVLRRKPLAVSRKPLVLTVARLEPEKGMQDLVAVATSLPQYDFLVVGNGSYHLQGDNVSSCSTPYSEIHKLYQKADLFFLPSVTTSTWEEQYAMALIEAMACGLPIVTTISGAIPEVLGESGLTLPEQDSSAMSQAIFEILSNQNRRSELSQLALTRAKKLYDATKVADQLAQLYR